MDIHARGKGIGVSAENTGEKTIYTETSTWVFFALFLFKEKERKKKV